MKTKEETWRLRCPVCGEVYGYVRKPKYAGCMYECGACHSNSIIVEHLENGNWVNIAR